MAQNRLNQSGVTFIEIMVTLIIFTLGITAIFKIFLISVDRMAHLTNRIYVSVLMENRLAVIEQQLRVFQVLPFDLNETEKVKVGAKELVFERNTQITEVEDYADVFQVDLTYTWMENMHPVQMTRSAYISDFQYQTNN